MKKKKAEKIILFLVMVALALLYIVPFLMMGLGSFKNQADAAKFDLSLPTQWIFSNYKHVLEFFWEQYPVLLFLDEMTKCHMEFIIILSLVLH